MTCTVDIPPHIGEVTKHTHTHAHVSLEQASRLLFFIAKRCHPIPKYHHTQLHGKGKSLSASYIACANYPVDVEGSYCSKVL